MLNRTILLAGVAAAMTVTSAFASSDIKFVGYSTQTVFGDSGFVTMHQACQEDFDKHSRMCTTEEFFKSPTAEGTAIPAWIHPVVMPDGGDFTSPQGTANCFGWNEVLFPGTAIPTTGAVVRSNGTIDAGSDSTFLCSVARPVTCCSTEGKED